MTEYPTVESALADLRDPERFATVVSVVLLDEHPDLVPTGGPGDLGRDAVIRDGLWGQERVAVQYSITRRWRQKLREELARHETDATLPPRLIFVTLADPQERLVRQVCAEALDRLRVHVTVLGRQWLAARLNAPRHRHTAERLLGVRPAPPPRLQPVAAYRASLLRHLPGFDAALVDVDPIVNRLAQLLESGDNRVILLSGEGGLGKTRLAIEAAGNNAVVLPTARAFDDAAATELTVGMSAVVVIDDAHRSPNLSALQPVRQDARFSGVRFLLTIRPGHEEELLHRAGVPTGEAEILEISRLARAAIDKLIEAPPYPVAPHDLRLRLIHMAQGRPLIAHMACEAAHGGDLLAANGERAVLAKYLERLIDPAWPTLYADLLAVCAALGGIELQSDGDWAALHHAFPGRAADDIADALNTLADHGALAVDHGGRLAVKPDRLAAYIVASRLLRPAPRQRLTYTKATDGLREPRRTRLVPVLSEAVPMADGEGRDILLGLLKHGPWPPAAGADTWTWYLTLNEAAQVARAAPDEVLALLDAFVDTWPPPATHQHHQVPAVEVLHPATSLVAAVASTNTTAAFRRLLDLSRLEVSVRPDRAEAVAALRNALNREEFDWRGDRTVRRAALFETVVDWAGDASDPRVAEVAALAMGELTTVIFVFSSRAAEDNLKFRMGSYTVDEEPDHARLVIAAAAYAASLVGCLDDYGIGVLIDRLAENRRIATGGTVGHGDGTAATQWGRQLLLAAEQPIAAALVARWGKLPIHLRHRLAVALPGHSAVTTAASRDDDLRRYAVVMAPGDRPGSRDEHLARIKAIVDSDGSPACARLLQDMAGEAARGPILLAQALAGVLSAEAAEALIRALAGSGHGWWPPSAALLAGSLQRHPQIRDVAAELAGRADAAPTVAGILDHLEPEAEAKVTAILATHQDEHTTAALAGHLTICERRKPSERGEALIALAAEQDDPHTAALALREITSAAAVSCSVVVPKASLGALAKQLARQLSMSDNNLPDLHGAFAVLAGSSPERATRLLIDDLTSVDRHLVPSGLAEGLRAMPASAAEGFCEEVGTWLIDHAERTTNTQLEDLLGNVSGSTTAFAHLTERLARGTRRQRAMAVRLVGRRFGEPLWERTVTLLLSAGRLDLSERAQLTQRLAPESDDVTPRDVQFEQRAHALDALATAPRCDGALAAFVREGAQALRAMAADHRRKERRHHEGYS